MDGDRDPGRMRSAEGGGACEALTTPAGSVTMNSAPVFEGATVVAQVDGGICAAGIVAGGKYAVAVASDAVKGGCGTDGVTVAFICGGGGSREVRAAPAGMWKSSGTGETVAWTWTSPPRQARGGCRCAFRHWRDATPPPQAAGPRLSQQRASSQARARSSAIFLPAATGRHRFSETRVIIVMYYLL